MTYRDDDDAIMADVPDVPNAIIDVVANDDVHVVNVDETEPQMANENEESSDDQLIVDSTSTIETSKA
jgi:hypothetical protein